MNLDAEAAYHLSRWFYKPANDNLCILDYPLKRLPECLIVFKFCTLFRRKIAQQWRDNLIQYKVLLSAWQRTKQDCTLIVQRIQSCGSAIERWAGFAGACRVLI